MHIGWISQRRPHSLRGISCGGVFGYLPLAFAGPLAPHISPQINLYLGFYLILGKIRELITTNLFYLLFLHE